MGLGDFCIVKLHNPGHINVIIKIEMRRIRYPFNSQMVFSTILKFNF